MARYNVLVTGAGAIIGYGIIKSLLASKYDCKIIGIDIYKDAVGQAWTDEFIQAEPASSGGYISFLEQLVRNKKIDIVFFGTEQEIEKVVNCTNKHLIEKCVLNRKSLIDLSNDKWDTYNFLVKEQFPAILSSVGKDYDLIIQEMGSPFLLKPRRSYAGKGMHPIKSKEEFRFWSGKISDENYMVQKITGDEEHEYTASVFGLADGTCIKPIVMKRKLSQEGATSKAYSIKNSGIEKQIYNLVKILKPVGPTNFQFRYEDGEYYLLEINPRISSSTSIRTLFGFNEAEMCIEWYLEHREPENREIRQGMALRFIDEWVRLDESGSYF